MITCCPRYAPVFDQRAHSELLERPVAGYQAVAHGAHHVDVAGPEPVHVGRPDGAPAQSRCGHVLARERHGRRVRQLPADARRPGRHGDVVGDGRRLRKDKRPGNTRAMLCTG